MRYLELSATAHPLGVTGPYESFQVLCNVFFVPLVVWKARCDDGDELRDRRRVFRTLSARLHERVPRDARTGGACRWADSGLRVCVNDASCLCWDGGRTVENLSVIKGWGRGESRLVR